MLFLPISGPNAAIVAKVGPFSGCRPEVFPRFAH